MKAFLKRYLHLQVFDHRVEHSLGHVALLLHFRDFFPQYLNAVFLLIEFADQRSSRAFSPELPIRAFMFSRTRCWSSEMFVTCARRPAIIASRAECRFFGLRCCAVPSRPREAQREDEQRLPVASTTPYQLFDTADRVPGAVDSGSEF
jgi:hypothetical protein